MTLIELREVFFWCSVINVGLMCFSFVIFLSARNLIYRVHGKMFRLSPEKLDTIMFIMIAFYKTIVFVFNVVPYFALCIVT